MIGWLAPIAWHYVVVGFGKDDVEARVGIRSSDTLFSFRTFAE
jgi:hypothetical protein